MSNERMKWLLQYCIAFIKDTNDDPKMILHDVCEFRDDELKELGFDYLVYNEEEF